MLFMVSLQTARSSGTGVKEASLIKLQFSRDEYTRHEHKLAR